MSHVIWPCFHFCYSCVRVHAHTYIHTHTHVIWSSQNYVSFFLNLAMKKPMVSESQSFSALWAKQPGSNLCTSWHSSWDREDCVNPQPPRWGLWNMQHHYFKVVHLPGGDSETHITTTSSSWSTNCETEIHQQRWVGAYSLRLTDWCQEKCPTCCSWVMSGKVHQGLHVAPVMGKVCQGLPVVPEWCQERCVRAYLLIQSDVRKGVSGLTCCSRVMSGKVSRFSCCSRVMSGNVCEDLPVDPVMSWKVCQDLPVVPVSGKVCQDLHVVPEWCQERCAGARLPDLHSPPQSQYKCYTPAHRLAVTVTPPAAHSIKWLFLCITCLFTPHDETSKYWLQQM